jgi:hypothetical protein
VGCPGDDCDEQIVFDGPAPPAPLAIYVGGSNYDAQYSFADRARVGHYDMLIVGFVHDWWQNTPPGCNGPIEDDLGALPGLLTNACIQRGPAWLAAPEAWEGCALTPCMGGSDQEGAVAPDVLDYQRRGGRVIISVGGANSNAAHMTPQMGVAFAHAIWNMYLGGADPDYRGWRPFGPNVVLDGVDLDLEQSPAGCPDGPDCLAVQEGWYNFVTTIRGLMDADVRKRYFITAVPINTKYADPTLSFPGYGAYTYGYLPGVRHGEAIWDPVDERAQRALDGQPPRSVYSVLWMLDYLWPQFYPSPVEITLNGDVWVNDLLAWTRMAARAPEGETSRCRVGVGLPFSNSAAGQAGLADGGQIAAEDAMRKIRTALSEHEVLRAHFGGMFGWDEYWDNHENQGAYGLDLRALLDDDALQDLLGD